MARFIFLFFLLLAHAEESLAVTEKILSFDDLPKLVSDGNKAVAGARFGGQAAEKRSGYLLRSFLPKVKGFVGYESFETGIYGVRSEPTAGVEASINVFRGGQDYLQSKIYDQENVSKSIQTKMSYSDALSTARRLYWTHVAGIETIELLKNIKSQNQKNLETALVRIRRGVGTDTDRLDFEIFRGQVDEEIESITHTLLQIRIELAAIVGRGDVEFSTSALIPHSHDDELMNKPQRSQRSQYYASVQQGSDLKASLANRWWLPRADVFAGNYLFTFRDKEYQAQKDRDETVVGVRLTLDLDIFSGGSLSSALSLEESGEAMTASQKQIEIEAKVKIAQEDMKHEHELVHSAEARIKQGGVYVSKVLDEYRRGVKNSIDVLNTIQRHLNFQREYVERRKNFQVARAEVLRLLNE